MACLLYASNTPLAAIERHLTRHQLGDGVAGAVRATADRTRDMIPAVTRVFEFLHPGIDVGDVARRTMVRLEVGIPAELAELASALSATLTRAQYLSLLEPGLAAPDQFELAEAAVIADCLSITEDLALELQETVRAGRLQEEASAALLPPPTE